MRAPLLLLLLAGAALAADWTDGTEDPDGTEALQSSNIKLILNPNKPKLTVLSRTSACPDGTDGCAGQFLMTSIKDLYEVDASGNKVNGRSAGDVLNFGGGAWALDATTDLSAVTTPALASVPTATFTAPFKPSFPACSPAAPLPAGASDFKFQVLLFPADTSFTAAAGLDAVEVLNGNVKSTLTISSWPFCSTTNKLVVVLALKSTKLGADDAPRGVSVKNGTEAVQEAQELADQVYSAVGAEENEAPAVRRRLQGKEEKAEKESSKPKMSRGDAVEGAGAGKGLNSTAKAALHDKVAKRRPVAGLGRPSDNKRMFLALPGTGAIDSKLDVPTMALVDGVATDIVVTAPSFNKGEGVQRVVLTFPAFTSKLEYDPTTAFATADGTLNEALGNALSWAAASCRLGGAGLLALAGGAAAALLLL